MKSSNTQNEAHAGGFGALGVWPLDFREGFYRTFGSPFQREVWSASELYAELRKTRYDCFLSTFHFDSFDMPCLALVFFDLDGPKAREDLRALRDFCNEHDIIFGASHSGGKGYHFFIRCAFVLASKAAL